jgi:hypothetical protein
MPQVLFNLKADVLHSNTYVLSIPAWYRESAGWQTRGPACRRPVGEPDHQRPVCWAACASQCPQASGTCPIVLPRQSYVRQIMDST